ncbi:MAG: hypothetical protein HQL69_06220 [Magnetococcales bacterium]|nr:hypothetical protein [Magnetococcales bacterium]
MDKQNNNEQKTKENKLTSKEIAEQFDQALKEFLEEYNMSKLDRVVNKLFD